METRKGPAGPHVHPRWTAHHSGLAATVLESIVTDEHATRAAGARYRDLFEAAPEPYLLTDATGTIRLANARAVELLDAPRPAVEGHDLASFVAPASRDGLQRQLARAAAGRGIHAWEMHLDGATRDTVLASIEPYTHPHGETELRWVLWDALPLDLSRGRLNRLLEDSQGDAASLRALAEWQASLLGAAAEDMETPLAVIAATLESLLQDGAQVATPVARSMLERASRQVLRLRRLLPTLLQLGRLQLEGPGADRRDVSLRQVTDEVLHDLDPLAPEVAYHFAVDRVRVDRDQLARMLVELVKHLAEHGPATGRIRIGAEPRGVDAELYLEVPGYRLADDARQVVFSPFPAAGRGGEDTDGGSLGLSLVAVFARMHGGRAWVQDAPDGASSFRVLLSNALPDADRRVDPADPGDPA